MIQILNNQLKKLQSDNAELIDALNSKEITVMELIQEFALEQRNIKLQDRELELEQINDKKLQDMASIRTTILKKLEFQLKIQGMEFKLKQKDKKLQDL